MDNIGLALSGGAARGIAHIGVLRALEEQEKQISKNLLGFLDNRQRKRHCIEYIGLYGMLSNI